MSQRRSRTSDSSTSHIRSVAQRKAHLDAMREKYVFFAVHAERSRANCSASVLPGKESAELYDRMHAEFKSNPRYPKPRFPRTRAGKDEYMRKCLVVCDEPAVTKEDYMIHWFTASVAMQFVSHCALDKSRASQKALGQALREIDDILAPDRQPYKPPADAFDAPQLLDWVGLSFTDPATKIHYSVEDAGTSVTIGAYFVLQTQDGRREQVSTKDFATMVAGLPIPSEDSEVP
ncbi:hypothetical protein BV25DRAFT_1830952 [Artomyces pyxidatus]|uniref:Uncharacterized protein n=1 Tax=Artomyces pyxidatus TaxID=48021 RepID=A0ACB8SLU2_9AGAM|nr:hypothetical protein BV25DRAFT_1830952 [Artomyces pyxidatus]